MHPIQLTEPTGPTDFFEIDHEWRRTFAHCRDAKGLAALLMEDRRAAQALINFMRCDNSFNANDLFEQLNSAKERFIQAQDNLPPIKWRV